MIHEYALAPAVLCDLKAFRQIAHDLGMHAGHMVRPFPKEWKKLCYQEAEKHGQNVKYAVTHWLQDRAPKVLTRHRAGSAYDLADWCDNAVQEHGREPFKAIIASRAASQAPPVINISDFDPADPLWAIPRQAHIQRTAAAFAAHIGPVLRYARQIRIVDPYFSGDHDQVQILMDCVACCSETVDWVELHVDGDVVKAPTATHAMQQIIARYPVSLPAPAIVRWKPGYLHDRLILTEKGGVTLGDSLRRHADRPDHIILLEQHVWQTWWAYHDSITQSAHLAL